MLRKTVSIIFVITAVLSFAYGFEMKGFMDVTYQGSLSEKAEEQLKNGAFIMGGLDYFLGYNVTDRLDVLSELVFEAPGGGIIVDVERIEIGYSFGDWLNLRAGRFHTPMGYYANTYHHGRQLDASIMRPLILEFEDAGGLVPGHTVGLWGRGNIKFETGAIKYNLAIVNGQKIDVDSKELVINMTSDDNKDKAVIAGIGYEFGSGLGLASSIYSGKVNGYSAAGGTTPVVDVDQQILGVSVYYDQSPVQIIAEYYSIPNKDMLVTPSKSYTSSGYFIQTGYEFKEKYLPYLRFEEVIPEKNDPYTTSLIGNSKISRITYGIRYKLSDESSVKLEGVSEQKDEDSVNIFGFQWAFLF